MSEHDTRGKVAISPSLPEAADLPSEAVSLRSTRNRKLVARIAIYSESPPEKLLLQAGDTDGHQFDQQLHLILSLLRSEEHTSELQSHSDLVCRLLLEKKKRMTRTTVTCHSDV